MVTQATLLAGSRRHVSYFPDHPKTLVIGQLTEGLQQLQQAFRQLTDGQYMVVLASGDPLFFGLGRLLLAHFPPEKVQFYPHVSAVQLALNRLKLPWQDVTLISAHGRSPTLLKTAIQQGKSPLAVLTDAQNHPGAIAQWCLEHGGQYQGWVCENLGGEEERIRTFSLPDLAALTATDFAQLNLVVLQQQICSERPIDPNDLPLLGIPDRYFASFSDRPGMMTKQAIRVQILAVLALQPGQIIWDIGAGTGSVAIECARLVPDGKIYAVEKTAAGQTLIHQNCSRFQIHHLTVIPIAAPDGLSDLPHPDRIFIGGSGGKLPAILKQCAQRLNPSGKLVLAIASLEHFTLALTWFRGRGWGVTVQQLQISQSQHFADLTRLSPLNPIYLVSASPPAT